MWVAQSKTWHACPYRNREVARHTARLWPPHFLFASYATALLHFRWILKFPLMSMRNLPNVCNLIIRLKMQFWQMLSTLFDHILTFKNILPFARLYYTMENVSFWVFYFHFDDVIQIISHTIGISREPRWSCHVTLVFCGKLGQPSPFVAISFFHVFWLAVQRRRLIQQWPTSSPNNPWENLENILPCNLY